MTVAKQQKRIWIVMGIVLAIPLGYFAGDFAIDGVIRMKYGTTPVIGGHPEPYAGHPGQLCSVVDGVTPRIKWAWGRTYEDPLYWEQIRIDGPDGVFPHGLTGLIKPGDTVCGYDEHATYHDYDLKERCYLYERGCGSA